MIKESDLINELPFERSKFPLETNYDDNAIIDKLLNNEAELQIEMINDIIVNKMGKKWIGISWLDDMGVILENKYPENCIKIDYKMHFRLYISKKRKTYYF